MTHIDACGAHRQRPHMTMPRFDHRRSEVHAEHGPESVTRVIVAMHGPRRGFDIARTVLKSYTLKLPSSHQDLSIYRLLQRPASFVCGLLHVKNHVVAVAVKDGDAFLHRHTLIPSATGYETRFLEQV